MQTKILSLIITIMAFWSGMANAQKVIQNNSTEISQLLNKNKSIVILDVRTPQEFAAGHLKGAVNIDIYQDNFYSRIDKLNKKTTYVVYCRTSNRSRATVDYMKQKGFGIVYQMMDGFPGWAANNLPFEK
jgi:rhodanese-related sulfurtransferase